MRPGRRSRVDAKLLLTSMSLPRHRSGLSGPEHPDSGRTTIRRHRQNHPDAFRRGGGTPRLDGGRSARPMWRSCCPRPGRGSSARLRCRSTMSGDPLVTPASHASCWVDRFALSHDARRTGPVVRGPDLVKGRSKPEDTERVGSGGRPSRVRDSEDQDVAPADDKCSRSPDALGAHPALWKMFPVLSGQVQVSGPTPAVDQPRSSETRQCPDATSDLPAARCRVRSAESSQTGKRPSSRPV